MATYTQIQTRAQSMAMSANATDAALFANDIYRDVVGYCRLNPSEATKTLVAGTWKYNIDSDWSLSSLIAIDLVTYASPGTTGTFDMLEEASDLAVIRENRSSSNGYVRVYAVRGRNVLLSPRPQGGDSVTLYYQAAPTAMSAGSDTPSLIDSQWQHVVTFGAAARLAQEEGIELAGALAAQYEAEREKYKRWLESAQGTTNKRIMVGYTRSPIRKHDPSEDRR